MATVTGLPQLQLLRGAAVRGRLRRHPEVARQLEERAAAGDAIPRASGAVVMVNHIDYKVRKHPIGKGTHKVVRVAQPVLRRLEGDENYPILVEATIIEKRPAVPSQSASIITQARHEYEIIDALTALKISGIVQIVARSETFDGKTRTTTLRCYMLFYPYSLSDKFSAPDSEKDLIVTQLIRTIFALHAAGYVHRDLKPDNIRITVDGKTVVIDFGSALSPDDLAATGAQLSETLANHQGTPAFYPDIDAYRGVELTEEHKARLQPADVCALGLTLASLYLPEEADKILHLAFLEPEKRDEYVNSLRDTLLLANSPFKDLVVMMLNPIEHSDPALTRPTMSELLEMVEALARQGQGVPPPSRERVVPHLHDLSSVGMLSGLLSGDALSPASSGLPLLHRRRAIRSARTACSPGHPQPRRQTSQLPDVHSSPRETSEDSPPSIGRDFPGDPLEATVVLTSAVS